MSLHSKVLLCKNIWLVEPTRLFNVFTKVRLKTLILSVHWNSTWWWHVIKVISVVIIPTPLIFLWFFISVEISKNLVLQHYRFLVCLQTLLIFELTFIQHFVELVNIEVLDVHQFETFHELLHNIFGEFVFFFGKVDVSVSSFKVIHCIEFRLLVKICNFFEFLVPFCHFLISLSNEKVILIFLSFHLFPCILNSNFITRY